MFRLRRLARWTGTLVVAVLLTIAAVAVVVETDWFKNWLRLRLVGGLASVLDGELRVGRLGGSLWTGVTLDEVEILNKDGQVVKADHIRVRYDPFTLARRRWIVDTVVVERASIQVVETADGWNVLHLLKPRPQSGNPPTVWIRKLELTDSTVTIDSRAEVPRTLTGVDLDSSLTVTRGVTSMTFDSLHAFDEVTGLTLHDLSGSASDNFRTFDVKFNADSAGMGIDGTAQGEMAGTTRTLSAVIDTRHVDLARLLGRPRLASDISGRANVQATLPPAGGQSRVTFQFSGPGSRAFGYAAEHIEAKGEIAGGAVKFDSRVSGYGAHATVEGTWRWATNARAATFAGRGTFASVDVRRLPATLRLPLLESNLSGRYDTAVDGNGWRAHAVFSGGVVEGATIGEGTEGNIVSAGGVTLYGGVGAASHVNLQRFGRVVPVAAISTSRFDSDLSGDFFVAGQTSADAPHLLVGGAILGSSVISGTNVSRMNAVAYLSERRLVVSANGKFEGLNDTTLGVPSVSIAATGEANGWFAIADIDLPITEDNLEVDARVDLRPSTIRGVAVDSAAVDARLMDGVLTLNSVDIRNPDATVRASGALGLHEAVASEGIALIADINDRTFLERMLQRPLLAAGSIDAKITGTVASPSATGSLTLHQISYNETTTALTSTTRFTVDWPERDVERLAWKVNGEASFVTFGNTELQRLTATAVGGLREMAVDVTAEQRTRSIGIEGRLTLKPDAHELLLRRLALTTENIAWSLPAEQSAVIKYAGNHLDISDLTLVRGEQRIMVAGGFDLEGAPHPEGGRTSLDVKVQNVELADINHILLGTRQLTGRVNGAVTIGGSRQDPVVDGEITIRDGLVETVPYQAVQTRGKYAGGVATIDALLDQAPGASLHVTGTVPIAGKEAASKSMDLHVSGGPVNLGLVQAFTTEIDKVLGDVALDLHLTGSIGDPIVNGTATLANGAFDVKGTGVRYRSIEAALDFAASQMSIRHLQVADGTGDLLTASGGLDVHRGIAARALDIQVRAKSFSVLANRFGTAELNADIRVSGELAAPVVKGTATLEGGRLEVAEILERTTATPYSTTAQAEPGAEPATPTAALTPWDRADIALQVRLPDNLVLRGRNLRVSSGGFGVGDMNIVTGGTFDVTKRPSAPIDIRGTLEVVRGSYSFQGRRFDIQRGSDVRFRGGSITDPFLNVNATREVSGITAEVRLRGSARSPELTLTSRPALDESDILSLIVFNQPVSSLGSAQQANLGQRAAAMAAGAIASPLADSIGRALNLDLFEIQAPTSEDGAGSVLIGSQLGSRVLLGLRQQFGRSDTSLVTLEYRVSELLRFVTTIASGTLQAHATRRTDRGGVDLIFVIRY